MESKNKTAKSKNKTGENKKDSRLSYILGGKVMTDFVIKQLPFFGILFIIVFCFITNRYYCSKQLSEMDRLKKELRSLNAEQLRLRTHIVEAEKQSNIEEMLRKKGIDLTLCNTAVYQITK